MPEVDPELSEMLSAAYEERMRAKNDSKLIKADSKEKDSMEIDSFSRIAERNRKLDIVRRVKSKEGQKLNNGADDESQKNTIPFSYHMSRQERQRDLHTIDIFRERYR